MTSQLDTVYRWTRQHAFLIAISFVIAIVRQSAVFMSIAGLLSFLYLIFQHPTIKTDKTEGGESEVWLISANWITFLRVIMMTAVGLTYNRLTPIILLLCGLVILATDWLDGYLAKRHNQSSLFGAQFDQESDAYFISIYSLIIYLSGYVGVWVIILGLIRYLNIIALYLLNQQHKKEPRFMGARIVAVVVMVALLIPFIAPSTLYTPYLIIAVVSLIISFGYTFSAQILQPE